MGCGLGMVSLHGVEVLRALGCATSQGEVPFDGCAIFLLPGDPPDPPPPQWTLWGTGASLVCTL